MKYIKEHKVNGCYHECYFFGIDSDGMRCNNPYFDDKKPYENMIITQQNSRNGKIPEKCPLRKDKTELHIQVSLNN
ncbi:MAG: hypothetical protein ACOCVF_02010 [bacterium]